MEPKQQQRYRGEDGDEAVALLWMGTRTSETDLAMDMAVRSTELEGIESGLGRDPRGALTRLDVADADDGGHFIFRLLEDFAGLLHLALAVPHGGIDAVLGEKFLMRAALGHLATLQHDDLVSVDDGGEAVGDDQRGAVGGDEVLSADLISSSVFEAVERRGGLVEDQDRRALEDGAGDGDALLLAARQLETALADRRVVALGQALR